MEAGRLFGRALARNAIARNQVRNAGYGGGNFYRTPTMNDLPTPQGDFFFTHAARQRRHNQILALGVAMFASTIYLWKESKLINLNFSPPTTYE